MLDDSKLFFIVITSGKGSPQQLSTVDNRKMKSIKSPALNTRITRFNNYIICIEVRFNRSLVFKQMLCRKNTCSISLFVKIIDFIT